jgi:hypothetical protein
MDLEDDEQKMQHMQALENALLILVDRLATRGSISVNEGVDILQVLSRGSSISSDRLTQSLNLLSKLRRLRSGDGTLAPASQ